MEGWRDEGMEGWRDKGWRDEGMEGWRGEGWRGEGLRDGGVEVRKRGPYLIIPGELLETLQIPLGLRQR